MGAEQKPQGPTLEQMGWKIDGNGQLVVASTGRPIHLTDEQKALMVDVQAEIDASVRERARKVEIHQTAMDVLAADVDLSKLEVRGADYLGIVRVSIQEIHELMILAIEADRVAHATEYRLELAENAAFDEYGAAMPANSEDMRPIVRRAILNAIEAKPEATS